MTTARFSNGRSRPCHLAARVTSAGFLLLLLASWVVPAAAQQPGDCRDPWPLKRGLLMYTSSPMPHSVLDKMADRFEFAVAGYPADLEYMLNKNSEFKFLFLYNSLTDNYVDPERRTTEHDWLMANAANYGLEGEDAYLHFREDTVLLLENQQVFIPGFNPDPQPGDPPASATSRQEARVPVYYADKSRIATTFATQAHRDMHRDFMVRELNSPMAGDVLPSGIMLDNSMNSGLRLRVVSGGAVLEHPEYATVDSPLFNDWHYFEGRGLYLQELTEYVDANPALFDNRNVRIMPNMANIPWIGNDEWERSYVNPPAGDILLLEFEYSPTRSVGVDLPLTIYQKHTQALAAGVSIFETGYIATGISGVPGAFSEEQALVNNVAAHWVHRADDTGLSGVHTYFLGVNLWQIDYNLERWERLGLAPIHDVDLGKPLGEPYVIASGADPNGNSYKVWARDLHCGLAVVRHRSPYNGAFDESSAVQFELGDRYRPLGLDGQPGLETGTWTLRNGEGQIFLSGAPLGDHMAPGSPENLREEK